jgi:hypothetical protein
MLAQREVTNGNKNSTSLIRKLSSVHPADKSLGKHIVSFLTLAITDRIRPMRRWLAILLLVFLPLQFSWAAVAGIVSTKQTQARNISAITNTSIKPMPTAMVSRTAS